MNVFTSIQYHRRNIWYHQNICSDSRTTLTWCIGKRMVDIALEILLDPATTTIHMLRGSIWLISNSTTQAGDTQIHTSIGFIPFHNLNPYQSNLSETPFEGTFNMHAYLAPRGVLTGGTFIHFKRSYFRFGSTCKKSHCTANTGTVFKGKLDSVGWSESTGLLEFVPAVFLVGPALKLVHQLWKTVFHHERRLARTYAGTKTFDKWKNTASGQLSYPFRQQHGYSEVLSWIGSVTKRKKTFML